jgi:hypothetical protein
MSTHTSYPLQVSYDPTTATFTVSTDGGASVVVKTDKALGALVREHFTPELFAMRYTDPKVRWHAPTRESELALQAEWLAKRPAPAPKPTYSIDDLDAFLNNL